MSRGLSFVLFFLIFSLNALKSNMEEALTNRWPYGALEER